jgi:hypothetical protein
MGLRRRWRKWRADAEQERRLDRVTREAAITAMEGQRQVVRDLLAERQRLIARLQEIEVEERRLRAELEGRREPEDRGSASD